MAGGYAAVKGGPEGLAFRILDLQRQIDQLRLAAGVKSAILRGDLMTWQTLAGADVVEIGNLAFPSTGNTGKGLQVLNHLDGAIIALFYRRDDDGDVRAQFGSDTDMLATFSVNADLAVFDPVVEFRVVTSDDINLTAGDQVDIDAGTSVFIGANGGSLNLDASTDVNISASGNVDIDPTGNLRFFIGSHATPANLSIASNVVRIVASAAKYKADIEDIVVDREALFAVSGKTYVDAAHKKAHDADPDVGPPTRYPGFIADEWAEHETLRQFVRFEDGEPEGFHYDRVTVVHHEVLKDHESDIRDLQTIALAHEHRITALEDENAELKSRLSAIEERLAHLEEATA